MVCYLVKILPVPSSPVLEGTFSGWGVHRFLESRILWLQLGVYFSWLFLLFPVPLNRWARTIAVIQARLIASVNYHRLNYDPSFPSNSADVSDILSEVPCLSGPWEIDPRVADSIIDYISQVHWCVVYCVSGASARKEILMNLGYPSHGGDWSSRGVIFETSEIHSSGGKGSFRNWPRKLHPG